MKEVLVVTLTIDELHVVQPIVTLVIIVMILMHGCVANKVKKG